MSETFVVRTNNGALLFAALSVAVAAPYMLIGFDPGMALSFLCIIGVYAIVLATGTICYKD
jgi:hypothetical protein